MNVTEDAMPSVGPDESGNEGEGSLVEVVLALAQRVQAIDERVDEIDRILFGGFAEEPAA